MSDADFLFGMLFGIFLLLLTMVALMHVANIGCQHSFDVDDCKMVIEFVPLETDQ